MSSPDEGQAVGMHETGPNPVDGGQVRSLDPHQMCRALLLSIDCHDSIDLRDWTRDDRTPLSAQDLDLILGADADDLEYVAEVEEAEQNRTTGEIDWAVLVLAGIIDSASRARRSHGNDRSESDW